MPRTARILLTGYPHHVVQRGHNRQAVFTHAEDYRFYVDNVREWKEKLGCKVYAYCLMTNHIHLVIEPCRQADSISLLMKRVAGRYTRYINTKQNRTGTVWEGRYKASPIDTGEYLLACCRYVEMNPVRAGVVVSPGEYRWSSYGAKAGRADEAWVDFDDFYLGLGRSAQVRQKRYRQFIDETVCDEEAELIRQAARRNQLTGGNRFIDATERKLGTRIELRGRGRPQKGNK